ncbi:lasso peptide biosynthesis PqqD family chaperone [Paenibacillus humicola]|uniref:lasso peptide biosynthesis PqqD family chaperone n=1 Tax=Paenibacillus humicola TaxID=3110540 RepID=UPI00237BB38F|nr:lasso peptide biosynthesis PqqD family chaperone [Paenibacillus humicola]
MHQAKQLSHADALIPSEGNIVSDMDGEKVMLSVQNGKYYNLGDMGGMIWDKLGPTVTVGQIIDALLEEYDVDPDVCTQQVYTFLQRLLHEGLIRYADAK